MSAFWMAFDKACAAGEASPVGAFLKADPGDWRPLHTGGGCMAWEMTSLEGAAGFWICTHGQGLGEAEDEGFLVGLHPDLEWNDHWQGEAKTIQEAVALCHAAHAARCFALFFRSDAKLTLAEFRATRAFVDDLGPHGDDLDGQPGHIYAGGGAHIAEQPGGIHQLVVGNRERLSSDLAELEADLYRFAYTEGHLDPERAR